jgi:hypothetical protein
VCLALKKQGMFFQGLEKMGRNFPMPGETASPLFQSLENGT